MKKLKKNGKIILALLIGVIVILTICSVHLGAAKEDLSQGELIGYIVSAVIVSSLVIGLSWFIYRKKDITPEKIFLYTMPIICILFIVFMPMYKSHDEHAHWHRIYEISTGKLVTALNQEGHAESTLPKSVVCPDWTYMNYGEVIKQLQNKIDNNDTTNDVYIVTSAVYSPIQYVAEGIAIAVARVVIKTPIILAYIGRLANLALCLFLMYEAIKKIPFGKNILLCIAYIPALIEGISSMSGDGVTFAVALFYLAYILSIAFDANKEKITKKDKIILTVFSILIASCKIVYLPFIGMLLLLPKEKYKDRKEQLQFLGIAWSTAMVISLGWLAFSGRYLADLSGLANSAPGEQTKKLITNPFSFVQSFFYNLELNGGNYLTQIFGSSIGWFEFVKLVSIVPYTLMFLFVFVSVMDKSCKGKLSFFQKVILLLVIGAILALTFLSLYIQWTKPESQGIDGIQGRYFIPLLPAIGLLLGSCQKIKADYAEQSVAKGIGMIGLMVQLQFILTIYIDNI